MKKINVLILLSFLLGACGFGSNIEPKPTIAAAASVEEARIIREQDWVKGATEPAVTIIEYGDFQCPGCAALFPFLERLITDHAGKVQVVYRHLPLTDIHANAQKAAEAAEAAGAQGSFWAYHDALFVRQAEWSNLDESAARDFFVSLAEELSLDAEQFRDELDEDVYTDYVSASVQEAQNLGLLGTPSIIFNDQVFSGDRFPSSYFVWDGLVKLRLLEDRQFDAPPPLTIDVNGVYRAHVEMESGQTFIIELWPQSAPQTVNNFIFLVENGWYDGITFHRVLAGLIAQTGDPTGTGLGAPGYSIPDEIDPVLSHDAFGMVAMANSGPDTNGSQWYVTLDDLSGLDLDGRFTIFGRVVEGMETVWNIEPRDPSQVAPGEELPPGDRIVTITIEQE